MRFRIAMSTASVLTLAAVIAGCGGSSDNGVAAKSPDAIITATTNAIDGVKSVHVLGSLRSGGSPIALNLELVGGKGASGQMAQSGAAFRIIALNGVVYINGSDAFWRRFGGNGAAQIFHGKWLKAPATGQFASLGTLTDLRKLFNQLLSNRGSLTKGGTASVAGQKVVAVTNATMGGTLYVATTGQPYPVEIVKTGQQGGHILFNRYNESVSLSAPSNAIDISQLQSKR